MTFGRDKPAAARDFGELTGDPWATGLINDAPNAAERQHWAERYDENVTAQLARAGVLPDNPAFDAIYQDAVNSDYTHNVDEPFVHGSELPLSKRQAILFAPEDTWRAAQEQSARGDALLNEYFRRNPDLRDREGLHEAVAAATEFFDDRGMVPSQNFSEFLNTVQGYHRAGLGPQHESAHRTSGIGSGTGAYRPDTIHPNLDDDAGLIGELRAIQAKGGFY
jgi:hypothetical protein